jgi:hypothetical protein
MYEECESNLETRLGVDQPHCHDTMINEIRMYKIVMGVIRYPSSRM